MTSRKRTFLWIIVAVPGLILATTAPLVIQAGKQKARVDSTFSKFSASLIRRDYPGAYALCSRQFKEATPFQDFVGIQGKLEASYGLLERVRQGTTEVESGRSEDRWAATVRGRFEYKHKPVEFLFEFHAEKGEWRVFGFKQL